MSEDVVSCLKSLQEKGLPIKGWIHSGVTYSDEFDSCQICGTPIKYIHTVTHPDVVGRYDIGCVCAGHMCQNAELAVTKEKEFKKKLRKLKKAAVDASIWVYFNKELLRWSEDGWKKSKNGNFLKKQDKVLIYRPKAQTGWKVKLGEVWGKKVFPTSEAAKQVVHDYLMKKKTAEAEILKK